MKNDYDPNPYVVKRPRRGLLLVTVVFALVLAGIFWANRRDGGEGERVGPPPGAPASEAMGGGVGTSGSRDDRTPRGTEDNSGPPAVVPPAIIQEFETVSGTVDGHELIGRRVDLHAVVHDVANDVAFWAGEGDNRVLVVMGRDNRASDERQRGSPSKHNIKVVQGGQPTRIQGKVQRLPRAEEMFSWRLTRGEAAELRDRRIYIRADAAVPIAN
jgi:hypothetical protein